MRITSTNPNIWISLTPTADNAVVYGAFAVEVSVNLGHGAFTARNDNLFFHDLPRFAADLNAFITNRSVVPHLTGTYDSYLRFSGTATSVKVDFSVGGAYLTADFRFNTSGSFEIDQEYLSALVQFFKANAA